MQILPGGRRQGAGDAAETAVSKGASRKARGVSECELQPFSMSFERDLTLRVGVEGGLFRGPEEDRRR